MQLNLKTYTNLCMLLVLCYFFISASKVVQGKQPPHIIFVLADDLGWGDVSFHGLNDIPTPNLDAVAYDGILLSNYYLQPICTPTRGALLTGRHPIHLGLQHGVILTPEPYGLHLNETLLPQYLKQLNYSTHAVGKWHLGFYTWDHTPTFRGFHSHYGYYAGRQDYWDHTISELYWGLDLRRNKEVVRDAFGKYCTDIFTLEAERIIKQHNTSQPLFLYLAHLAVHTGNSWKPLEAPRKYYDRFPHIKSPNRRMYAAMVSALDDSFGRIMRALQENGMLENSIIVFSTDNGGPANSFQGSAACNLPLRGIKETLWDGGMRGAGFVWSPLLQKSGYTYQHMMQVDDWAPTLLEAAGWQGTLHQGLDGVSQWKALSNNALAVRTEMLHNIDPVDGSMAMRRDVMKLVYAPAQGAKSPTAQYPFWYGPEGASNATRCGANNKTANGYAVHRSNDATSTKNNANSKLLTYEGIFAEYNHKLHTHSQCQQNTSHLGLFDKETLLKEDNSYWSCMACDVLISSGRGLAKPRPLTVDCGPVPPDRFSACNVTQAPCLFNIETDPCEYNNIASQYPEVVQELLETLERYNSSAVPPLNKPPDPKSNPNLFGGVWSPWVNSSMNYDHEIYQN